MNLDRAYFTHLQQRTQWKPRWVIQFWVVRCQEFSLFSFQTAATLCHFERFSLNQGHQFQGQSSKLVLPLFVHGCAPDRQMISCLTEQTSGCPSVFLPLVFRESPAEPVRIYCLEVHGSRMTSSLQSTVLDHSSKLLSRVYPNEY